MKSLPIVASEGLRLLKGGSIIGRKIRSGEQLYFTKKHDMVRRSVRDFVNKEINPYLDEWEEKGASPLHDLFKKMGDLGFLGIRYDPEYGGEGLDYWHELVVIFFNLRNLRLSLTLYIQKEKIMKKILNP